VVLEAVRHPARMGARDRADWIAINGEGIYGTRPWTTYGEGPVRSEGGAAERPPSDHAVAFAIGGVVGSSRR